MLATFCKFSLPEVLRTDVDATMDEVVCALLAGGSDAGHILSGSDQHNVSLHRPRERMTTVKAKPSHTGQRSVLRGSALVCRTACCTIVLIVVFMPTSSPSLTTEST